ncbi:Glycoside hydrolase superfamily [Penicillium sp. DV-2018c]|nr:Glycoside hydrolase superfamily [Penicillium sp. DV-2018c]KAJ5567521.1 Glycoside hydrolase superfamily [Penicillium sp. DV-2018c]
MKRLTQAFVGLLLACGVCVEAQAWNLADGGTAERRCNGALAQPPSVREVVVWVDENGKPVNMDTGHDLKPTLAPPENVST